MKKEIEIKNQELETIMEKTSDAMICISNDGKIKYINENALKILTIDRKDIDIEKTHIKDIWQNSILEKAMNGYGCDLIIEEEVYKNKESEKKIISSQITKVYKGDELVSLIGSYKDSVNLQRSAARYRDASFETTFDSLIGENPTFISLKQRAKAVANSDSNILITAETGTGKELLARAIHNASKRKENPFVTVNCSAIPESLLETELFGYEGGITGVENFGKIGKMELANAECL